MEHAIVLKPARGTRSTAFWKTCEMSNVRWASEANYGLDPLHRQDSCPAAALLRVMGLRIESDKTRL